MVDVGKPLLAVVGEGSVEEGAALVEFLSGDTLRVDKGEGGGEEGEVTRRR